MSFLGDAWDGVCDAASAFSDNFMDAVDEVGFFYGTAADAWSDGNYLGAFHRGLYATVDAVGNTITLGGAHAIGSKISDDLDSGDAGAIDKLVGYVAANEAESMLMQDDLYDGKYVEYEYDKDTGSLNIVRDSNGNAKIIEAQTDEDREKFKNIANGMAAVDVVGDAFDVVTVVAPGASSLGKTAAKAAAKEGAEEVAEQTAKQIAKNVAKEGAKEIAEEVAEQTAKEAVKEVAEEGAEFTAKQIVKEVAKEGAKETVKQTAKQGVKETGKRITLRGIKVGMKTAAMQGTALYVGNRVISGQTYADAKMYSGTYAATHAMGDLTSSTVDIVKTAVDDFVETAADSFLAKFPGLGKFVNTCRAGAYATSKCVSHNMIGAGAVAAVVKPYDYLKSKLIDRQGKYFGKSISDVAKELNKESLADGKNWTDHYVEKVMELDASIGVDSSFRRTVVAYNEPTSSDEPEFSPA